MGNNVKKKVFILMLPLFIQASQRINIALRKPVYANNYYLDSSPGKAVDGDTTTSWNSGTWHPAWLGIDLGGYSIIDSINVKLAQTPPGVTAFQAWVYSDTDSVMVARWEGNTEDGSWLRKGFDKPLGGVDRVKICSEQSPSWISYYEVRVIGAIEKKKKSTSALPAFPRTNIRSVIDSSNCFATEIYRKVSQEGENFVFSPYSIFLTMAMAFGGARNQTEREIARVFHFADNTSIHASLRETVQSLENINGGKIQLLIASSVWPEKSHSFLPQYLELLKTVYGVSVRYLDYAKEAESALRTINAWVSDKTRGKITELIRPGSLDESTKLVLTNAIYMKAAWMFPFEAGRTSDGEFTLLSGGKVRAIYMHKTETFGYTETGEIKALELPYSERNLSMLVLLPEKNNLAEVEKGLSYASLQKIINSLSRPRVRVMFPKFRMESAFSLSKTFSSMGMPSAFSGKADFSGMDGNTGSLYISEVIHKAFIDVTEEGTEASAATGITIRYVSQVIEPEPREFIADHPFIFIILHNATGNIIFIGRLANP